MLKFLLVIAIFALATYLTVRMLERRAGNSKRPAAGRPRPQPRPRPKPVAPDDDEDFLRDLDRKRKHPEDPDQT